MNASSYNWFKANRTALLHVLLILIVVSAVYANAPSNGFVTDDFPMVVENPNVKSVARLAHVLASGYWDSEGNTGGLYRPFTILTFMAEYSIAGLNPVLYHIDNIALHFICSVLAYLLMRKIFDGTKAPLFAALLFAAHPVHTEAVTWISGRAELLWAVFGLASILVFMKFRDRPAGVAVSVAFYLLALFSKESGVVVLPLVAAWMLLFEQPRPGEKRLVRLSMFLWPYLAATAAFAAARFYVLGGLTPNVSEQAVSGLAPFDRSLIMSRVFYEYVRLGFFPASLNVDYIFPPPDSILDPRVLFTLAVVLLAVVYASRITRRSRPLAFAGLWFAVTLLPVSNIIPTGIIMSDRAMYVPSLGACMAFGAAIAWLEGKKRYAGIAVLVIVLGLFGARALHRNADWKDQDSLSRTHASYIEDGIARYPDYNLLYKFYAQLLLSTREYGPDTEKAIRDAYGRLGKDDPEIRDMMSLVYENQSRPDAAFEEALAAVKMDPSVPRYRYRAARLYFRLKRYDEAVNMIDSAIRLNPNKDLYRMLKGDIMMEAGVDDAALAEYSHAAGLNPENYDAFLMQGIILDSDRQFGPAVENIRKAVSLRPDIPDLHYFLAVAYLDAGKPRQAREELEKAVALRPDYREAVELLGNMPDGQGRTVTPQAPPG